MADDMRQCEVRFASLSFNAIDDGGASVEQRCRSMLER